MTEKIAMTVDEAADYTGVGRNTIRQLISWGSVPVLYVGRKKLIRTDVLDRFLLINQGADLRDREAVKPVCNQSTFLDKCKFLLEYS